MALTDSDLSAIRKIVKAETDPIKSDTLILKKGQRKIKKDLKTTINFFDQSYLKLKEQVVTISNHLGISIPEF